MLLSKGTGPQPITPLSCGVVRAGVTEANEGPARVNVFPLDQVSLLNAFTLQRGGVAHQYDCL